MRRAALDALFYLLCAAGIIAGAISLASGAEPVVAPRPTRWLESPHAGQCESQWLRLTPHNGYRRTWRWIDGETWYLVDGLLLAATDARGSVLMLTYSEIAALHQQGQTAEQIAAALPLTTAW